MEISDRPPSNALTAAQGPTDPLRRWDKHPCLQSTREVCITPGSLFLGGFWTGMTEVKQS